MANSKKNEDDIKIRDDRMYLKNSPDEPRQVLWRNIILPHELYYTPKPPRPLPMPKPSAPKAESKPFSPNRKLSLSCKSCGKLFSFHVEIQSNQRRIKNVPLTCLDCRLAAAGKAALHTYILA